MFELSIVAVSKNEGLYIREWIEYHRLQGIDHIFLYDAGTDLTKELVKPYVEEGYLTYILWDTYPAQWQAYSDFCFNRTTATKWAAFIDLDEYIVPMGHEKIKDIIRSLDTPQLSAVAIGWAIFGNNGHLSRPPLLVTEAYTRTINYQVTKERMTKCIVKPVTVKEVKDPHYLHPKDGFIVVREDGKEMKFGDHHHRTKDDYPVTRIRLNHYFTKSLEDFIIKLERRGPDGAARKLMDFVECNSTANETVDYTIWRWLTILKERMGRT